MFETSKMRTEGKILDDLIKKIKKGDKATFEALVGEYQVKVFSLCMGLVSNREDALDLTQEVFIKIYRNAKQFKGESKLSTWIYRIVQNTCMDFLRRERRYTPVSLPDILPDSSPSPYELAAAAEDRERVRKALLSLPTDYKSALLLREYEGLSYSEIADILGISEGTVKSRISRARTALAKILTENLEQNSI